MRTSANEDEHVALPAALHKRYLKSKRDTNKFLDWLRRNAAKKLEDAPFGEHLSIADILRAAKLVVDRKIEPPADIGAALRRFISARRAITHWYQRNETMDSNQVSNSTKSHEFFNNTLASVQDLLFPSQEVTKSKSSKVSGKGSIVGSNIYEKLQDIITSGNDDNDDNDDHSGMRRDREQHQDPEANDADMDYTIEDDPLADLIDPCAWLRELDHCATQVVSYSSMARDGDLPLAVASTLSDTWIDHLVEKNRVAKRMGTSGAILNQLYRMEPDMSSQNQNPTTTLFGQEVDGWQGCNKLRSGYSLYMLGLALKDFKRKMAEPGFLDVKHRPIHEQVGPDGFHADPSWEGFNIRTDVDQAAMREHYTGSNKDYQGMLSILKSYWAIHLGTVTKPHDCHMQLNELVDYLEVDTPMCPNLHCPCVPISTISAWYLQMVLDTSKVFYWRNLAQKHPVNCRLQALQFAQELRKSIEDVQAVNDEASWVSEWKVRVELKSMKAATESVIKGNCFDLLAQSPLVAGRQNARLLHWAFYEGSALLNLKSFFGTLLHLYKVCHTVTGSTKASSIPALDSLCNVFKQAVFLGKFPTSEFHSLYVRFANLYYKKNSKGQKEKMVDHDRASIVEEGRQQRIDPGELSPWYDLVNKNARPDGAWWARAELFQAKAQRSSPKVVKQQTERFMARQPVQFVSAMLQDIMRDEWNTGDQLPRVNLFRVYLLAHRTMAALGQRWMERVELLRADLTPLHAALHDLEETVYYQGQYLINSLASAGVLFGYLDEVLGDSAGLPRGFKRLERSPYKCVVEIAQEVIGEIWGDLKLEDLHWKHI